MPASAPIASAPLVWAELITRDVRRAEAFYGPVLGWRPTAEPGSTDYTVYLDQARIAGPVCGIRPRSPLDAHPPEHAAPDGLDGPADRWSVRLSPPRPPAAVDPAGDQLLRPRAPGPRLGRWGAPQSLCFAELRTADVEGAKRWMEGRLDALVEALDPGAAPGLGTQLLKSSVNPDQTVAAIVDEPDPARGGWTLCVQVPSIAAATVAANMAGALAVEPCELPAGAVGTAAAELIDPGGARLLLIEHGPIHGRR